MCYFRNAFRVDGFDFTSRYDEYDKNINLQQVVMVTTQRFGLFEIIRTAFTLSITQYVVCLRIPSDTKCLFVG